MVDTVTGNLIVNGGADGPCATDFASVVTPIGWNVITGKMTAIAYSPAGDTADLNTDDSAAIGGGNAYFAGGPGADFSWIQQDIDLTAYGSQIDGGDINFTLGGDLGGYLDQNDYVYVRVEWLNQFGEALGLGEVSIVGGQAADRGGVTELVHQEVSYLTPYGARYARVSLVAQRQDGVYNDGYADNLSLTLSGPDLAGTDVVVRQTQDFSSGTVPAGGGVSFQAAADVTATFAAEQFGAAGLSLTGHIIGDGFKDTLAVVVGAGQAFDGSGLEFDTWTLGLDVVKVTGSAAADAIAGTAVNDSILAGAGADTVNASAGGLDTISGGDGDDTFVIGAAARSDKLDGGAGWDTVEIDSAAALTLKANLTHGVEEIRLGGFGIKTVTVSNAAVAAGATLTVDATSEGLGVRVNGAAEANGHLVLIGGGGNDRLTGGGVADTLNGGDGRDLLTGGGGGDVFLFNQYFYSSPANPDTIADFAHGDIIDLHLLDADLGTAGDQAFHIGKTHGHAGDIVISYSAAQDRTTLLLYVDADTTPDAKILLDGDHRDLAAADFAL